MAAGSYRQTSRRPGLQAFLWTQLLGAPVGTALPDRAPRLWLPKREQLTPVPEIPTLGTGKIDLRARY